MNQIDLLHHEWSWDVMNSSWSEANGESSVFLEINYKPFHAQIQLHHPGQATCGSHDAYARELWVPPSTISQNVEMPGTPRASHELLRRPAPPPQPKNKTKKTICKRWPREVHSREVCHKWSWVRRRSSFGSFCPWRPSAAARWIRWNPVWYGRQPTCGLFQLMQMNLIKCQLWIFLMRTLPLDSDM